MIKQQTSKKFAVGRWFYAVLLALVIGSAAARAAEQRWLFVFDTSAAMKKRLPEVEKEIQALLNVDFIKSIHQNDSIGVWTFSDRLEMGKFPLITWQPWEVGQTTTNLIKFIHKHDYSGNTSFTALQPTLNSVVEDSERLTVVIVCDGMDEIHWTPYDEGMNETLKQTRDDRARLHEPYVIVMRTQQGKYVGATVNFPPIPSNLPPFPLLPREIKTVPAPPPPPVAPVIPAAPAPPLVIVGTHVSSDTNDVTKYLATNNLPAVAPEATAPPALPVIVEKPSAPAPVVPPVQNPAPPPAVAHVVNLPPVSAPPARPAPVAVVPAPAPAPSVPAPSAPVVTAVTPPDAVATNADAAAKTSPDDRDTRLLTYVGVALLGAAIVLVILLLVRGRSNARGSLITSSMYNDPRRIRGRPRKNDFFRA